MEVPRRAFSDSEDELEMDFNHSPSSFSESASSYTLDSGISSGVPTGSDNSWSPLEIEAGDEYWTTSTDVLFSLEAQSVLVNQAVYFLLTTEGTCVTNSSAYLFHLCRNGCSNILMQSCPELLTHLLVVVRSSSRHGIEVLHFLSGILHYFSHTEEGVEFVLTPEGLEILSHFLESSIDSVLYYTVTTIHNILLVRKSSRDLVRGSQIVNRLIHLLKFSARRCAVECNSTGRTKCSPEYGQVNPKFLAILFDCLHILAYGHEATKRAFLDGGGVRFLLSLLEDTNYEKLLWTGTRLMRVMSAWLPAKLSVLSEDKSLSFLIRCFVCGSLRVIANALWTLRNLSDVAVDKLELSVLMSVVGHLLLQLQHVGIIGPPSTSSSAGDSRDQLALSQCILGILGNLTCGNGAVKSHMVELNGVDLISRVLQSSLSSFDPRPKHTTKDPSIPSENTHLCDSLSSLSLDAVSVSPSLRLRSPSMQSTSSEERELPFNDPSLCSSPGHKSDSLFSYCLAKEIHDQSYSVVNPNQLMIITSPPCSNPISTALRTTTYDPSCPSLAPDIPHSKLNATLDLLEAGFRCLSHLTAGHPKVSTAVSHLFQSRASAQMLNDTISHVFLPLLSHYTTPCDPILYPPKLQQPSSPEPISQLLQLIRAWTMVVHNVYATCCANDSGCPPNRNRSSHKRHAKPLFCHLRRSLRSLSEHLSRLSDLMATRTKDLTVAQDLVHHLMSRITAGSNLGVKTPLASNAPA
ncbi:hypothetical protein CRM22_006919 [Opisthorchis felineus]|uniref:Junction plakoglobin n=1 Tax=Opisthorchis felineus TaxID=147828 RepID=A0A4S2LQ91_OPIFE|nr:hypothetical protein CRM22_006919 [Opisthorchis felineus]